MKIVQVTSRFPPSIGGVENHVYNLSYELSLRGHEVTVLTSDIKNISFLKIDRADKPYEKITDNFEVYRFKAYPPNIPYAGIYATIPALIKKLIKLDPDIINTNSHGLIHTDITSILSKIRKIPMVLTIHSSGDIAARSYMSLLLKLYNTTHGKFSLKAANRIIVTSPQMAEYFYRWVNKEKIRVIPNGIEYKKFINMPPVSVFKSHYNVKGKVVLFVGRLLPLKGIQYMLKAAPQILKQVPETNFVIVGAGSSFKRKLEELSHNLGVDDRVVFTGFKSGNKLLEAYSSADVFVLPSIHREGLSIVTLEAMASGIPVVVSNLGGLPSIVKDGVTGLLVEPKNEGQLADSIIKLLLDENLALEMGDNGKKVAKSFDWQAITEKTEDVYKEVIHTCTS